MSDFVAGSTIAEAKQSIEKLRANMQRTIKGKDDVIERAIVCMLAKGHLLIEDLPGVGKTTLAYSLARSLDTAFSRIQFTSDLLPSDVTGVAIYDETSKEFIFKKGPVFASIVLADEINRATPKTQSALLEVMDRGKVTIDGETHAVDAPFMVFATQNPVDYEGTFPLPESQMDRFLMRIQMGYPAGGDEMDILRAQPSNYDDISLDPVLTRTELIGLQNVAAQVFVEDSVLDYILSVITATRTESEFKAGISVRGGLALKAAAQALALVRGRDFVIPDDVSDLIVPTLGHRLGLTRPTSDALEERRAIGSVLKRIIESLPEPQ